MLEVWRFLDTLGVHSHQVDDLPHCRSPPGTTAQTEGLQSKGQEEIIFELLATLNTVTKNIRGVDVGTRLKRACCCPDDGSKGLPGGPAGPSFELHKPYTSSAGPHVSKTKWLQTLRNHRC